VIRTEEDHLAHYGILRRSGRYPWGSGRSESTRNRSFLDTISMLRKDGMSDTEIARGFGITRNELTAARSIARAQQKQEKILTAQRLKDKGWSNVEIGKRMGGLNESSVRALLAPGEKDKADAIQTTANMLKDQVGKKEMIDVGKGVESQLGVTRTRLDTAIAVLREQGYELHNIDIQQIGTGKYTTMKVLAKPGTSLSQVQRNRADIKQITDYSIDHGRSYFGMEPPISVNSRRVRINWAETGGDKLDGVIYVRPGVKDLHLGSDRYGQVRVMIDGTHYIKGMAVYKDDLPAGVDLVVNTNKANTGRKKDAMKPLEDDPELPFGSVVRQIHDPATGKVTSAMNIIGVKEGSGVEGSWDKWSRTLSSQMLSKQNPDLAKQQLDLTFERRRKEFDEISSLTNSTVRKELLMRFADQTDAASVHLKAANLPRQATKVILPIPSMKDNEVYAPSMRHGERVALIRFPHGGTFEIPELTVNNRNRDARKIIGTSARDAIGINHNVAHHLSGADFDGDTVLVVPNNRRTVKTTPALEELKGFDPMVYKLPKDSPIPKITNARKQMEMGKVSNLITDMTIKGAPADEIARAVRHSMVVIDSEKHGLDFLQSEKDNGILSLKEKYQGGAKRGAQTIVSRKKSTVYIPERIERPAARGGPIDPVTGRKVYVPTGRMRPERVLRKDPVTGQKVRVATGRTVPVQQRIERLALAEDAQSLVSRNPVKMELLYAEHSNRLKAMANDARKQALQTKGIERSPSAAKVYAHEVDTLNAKLNLAKKNAPLERQAQLLANVQVSQRRQANPHIEPEDIKKIKQQALNEGRIRTGAKKTKINITQNEWDAIQAGAISNTKLTEIINNSDLDTVKFLAMPKFAPKMTTSKRVRAQSMLESGYTQQDVADALGVSLTTLKVSLSE
jgi:transcriptional regulator